MRKFVATPAILGNHLRNARELRPLLQDALAISGLDELWQSLLPIQLRDLSHVGRPQDGLLTIIASSGMVAARLRQMLPALERELTSRGIALRLKVRVSIYPGEPPPAERPARTMPDAALQALGDLESGLDPDDPLARSVARLLKRRR